MKTEVLELRSLENGKLIYLVNLKSIENYKNILKVKQTVNVGGLPLTVRYSESTLEELYKHQLEPEIAKKFLEILEKQLYFKNKDIIIAKSACNPNNITVSLKKQTVTINVEKAVFVYKAEDIYSKNLFNYIHRVSPEKMNEASLAFYEFCDKLPLVIIQQLKLKETV
jgi:hypothetical protein